MNNVIDLEIEKGKRIAQLEPRRAPWEITEHDDEFYFHGFDRPFSRAELLLIAAQCEARGIGGRR